jgi:hypothetical protein
VFGITLQTILFIGLAIVHVGFALNVLKDGDQIRAKGSQPLLAAPVLWCLATLLGGVFVAAIYWVVNHSTLSRR